MREGSYKEIKEKTDILKDSFLHFVLSNCAYFNVF